MVAMSHGVNAYNDARGCGTQAPDPCGHHCDPEWCPACGDAFAEKREAAARVRREKRRRQEAEIRAEGCTCADELATCLFCLLY